MVMYGNVIRMMGIGGWGSPRGVYMLFSPLPVSSVIGPLLRYAYLFFSLLWLPSSSWYLVLPPAGCDDVRRSGRLL